MRATEPSEAVADAAGAPPAVAPTDALPRGLVWVTDAQPGIRRSRDGDGFAYRRDDGRPVDDEATLARIRALAIPPAYEDVWICARPDGYLQATGRDARGRKQYRYHARYRAVREATKFERMAEFGRALPKIRRRVERDLAAADGARHPTRALVLATIVRLLDTTWVRVGNAEYARQNGSFGVTTLQARHAAVRGPVVRLRFRGKSGKDHEVRLDDARVARVVRRCQQLPGQELFRFVDADGELRTIGSFDVNDWLEAVTGERFTAKDFRTWHGSVQALALLCAQPCDGPDALPTARRLSTVVAEVARRLGNTAAVCRKSYIHPEVLALADAAAAAGLPGRSRRNLSAAETALLALLERSAAPPFAPQRLDADRRATRKVPPRAELRDVA